MPTWSVIESDCVEAMRSMEANSFNAVVCDPPYHLASSKDGSRGFMGKTWDGGGIAFRPETWREVLRVAKPGAFLIAFGGTRTSHRLACAIEDAGWEIRDSVLDLLSEDEKFEALWSSLTDEQRAALAEILDAAGLLAWVRGQGFPKTHDPAASIDKMLGFPKRGRAIPTASTNLPDGRYAEEKLTGNPVPKYEPRTEEAAAWGGFGIALRPLFEPIVLARKPLEGTVAANVLKWGTGVLNIDGTRIAHHEECRMMKAQDTGHDFYRQGGRYEDKLELKPEGRWPANVVLSHHPDCVLVGSRTVKGSRVDKPCPDPEVAGHRWGTLQGNRGPRGIGDADGNEEVETWACVPGCPVRMLDDSCWTSTTGNRRNKNRVQQDPGSTPFTRGKDAPEYTDSGGASRFFFCAKAARSEREAGLLGVVPCAKCGGLESTEHPNGRGGTEECVRCNHPTVKPLGLVSWLARLCTPPSGRVLDPFTGSGTTGAACMHEGFDFVGIDSDPRSVLIAKARIEHAAKTAGEEVVAERAVKVARGEVPKAKVEKQEQLGLLAGLAGTKEGGAS